MEPVHVYHLLAEDLRYHTGQPELVPDEAVLTT